MFRYAVAAPNEGLTPRLGPVLQRLIMVAVWLTVVSGAIVFTEPAPFDIAMVGLIVVLPAAGLVIIAPGISLYGVFLLLVAAGGLVASAQSLDLPKSAAHTFVTLYLSLASVVIAGFVRRDPPRHVPLIMNAYLVSAVIAAGAGIAGYFHLVPGADDVLTVFGRARGTFKDPNVLGAFLVPATLYALYLSLARPLAGALAPAALAGLFATGVLVSFSRGAWTNLAVATIAFGYLSFVVAPSNRARVGLAGVGFGALVVVALGVVVMSQSEQLRSMIEARATLEQSYDIGPYGRFAGHDKAVGLIIGRPLGIGATEFNARFHPEDVHNVYYSMFLNAGWFGGLVFAGMTLLTLAMGLGAAFKRQPDQGVVIVVWSCFLGVAVEGLIIDTDHWRHLFVLSGMMWGLVAIKPKAQRHELTFDPGANNQRLRQRTVAFVRGPAMTSVPSLHDATDPLKLIAPGTVTRATQRLRLNRRLRAIRRVVTRNTDGLRSGWVH